MTVFSRSRGAASWSRWPEEEREGRERLHRRLETRTDLPRLEDHGRGSAGEFPEPLGEDAPEPEDEDRTEGGILLEGEEGFGGRAPGDGLHLLGDQNPEPVRAFDAPAGLFPYASRRVGHRGPVFRREGESADVRFVEDLR